MKHVRLSPRQQVPGVFTRPTERELDVIALRRIGKPYKEIAPILGISEDTVSEHLSNLNAKLGVSSSIEAVFHLRDLTEELETRARQLVNKNGQHTHQAIRLKRCFSQSKR